MNKRSGSAGIEFVITVVIAIIIIAIPLTIKYGCMASGRAKLGGLGSPHKIEVFSGGKLIREYTSEGKVRPEENSDGYYFMDKESGKLIEVEGDIIITRLD